MKYHLVALACWSWMCLVAFINYSIDPWSPFVLQMAVFFLGVGMPLSQLAAHTLRSQQEGKADG